MNTDSAVSSTLSAVLRLAALLLHVLCNTATARVVASGCLEDPVTFFAVFDDRLDFENAVSFCQRREMNLTRISNAAENDFVLGLLEGFSRDVWIGKHFCLV